MKFFPFFALVSVTLPFLLSAQEASYFPEYGADWASLDPTAAGFDAKLLEEAVRFARENEYSGAVDLRQAILKGFEREPYHKILGPTKGRGGPAGMILKKGYLIAQWGDIKRVDMTFSVTKSYLSTVAGIALQKGVIRSLEDKVADYVWDGTFEGAHNSKITWEHLLNQSSDWSGTLWGGQDWADRPPQEGGIDEWRSRSLQEPGTVFEYNDVRVNVLAYALLQVLRAPLPEVLLEEIMEEIGASSTWRWFGYDNSWTNLDGQWVQSVSGGGHSGGGLFISTEDHARFGLLFQNNGRWENEQLIDPAWIEAATTHSSTNLNYGYMWWLNNPEGPRYWEAVPASVFYAAGFGGNYIVVAPEQQLVIVTRWLEPRQMGTFTKMVFEALK